MAVKKLGLVQGNNTDLKLYEYAEPEQFTGLATDTTAWLDANKTLMDGSTYRELDGTKDLYEIQSGTWYKQ